MLEELDLNDMGTLFKFFVSCRFRQKKTRSVVKIKDKKFLQKVQKMRKMLKKIDLHNTNK